jgi:hypothetical protein
VVTLRSAFAESFPKLLERNWAAHRKWRLVRCGATLQIFASRKITFAEKQLGWRASKLRCAVSNAAMHPQETRNLLLLSEQHFGTEIYAFLLIPF